MRGRFRFLPTMAANGALLLLLMGPASAASGIGDRPEGPSPTITRKTTATTPSTAKRGGLGAPPTRGTPTEKPSDPAPTADAPKPTPTVGPPVGTQVPSLDLPPAAPKPTAAERPPVRTVTPSVDPEEVPAPSSEDPDRDDEPSPPPPPRQSAPEPESEAPPSDSPPVPIPTIVVPLPVPPTTSGTTPPSNYPRVSTPGSGYGYYRRGNYGEPRDGGWSNAPTCNDYGYRRYRQANTRWRGAYNPPVWRGSYSTSWSRPVLRVRWGGGHRRRW